MPSCRRNSAHSIPPLQPLTLFVSRRLHTAHRSPSRLLPLLRLLLPLAALICLLPQSYLSDVPPARQQHNVWYNGLQITGIAVDEQTGDVFFSDAAGNRVIHQTRNGSLVRVYNASGYYSPMQLAFLDGRLYVADSANARMTVIDVSSGDVQLAFDSALTACSALAFDAYAREFIALDGWNMMALKWELPCGCSGNSSSGGGAHWTTANSLDWLEPTPRYLSSLSRLSSANSQQWYLLDPTESLLYGYQIRDGFIVERSNFQLPGVVAHQHVDLGDSGGDKLYVLSQPAPDSPMQVAVLLINSSRSSLLDEWTAPGRGGGAVPFYGSALHVDSSGAQYISDHGVDARSSPHGRVVKLGLGPNHTEQGSWTMSDGEAHAFSSVWYHSARTHGGACSVWLADVDNGMVRVSANGTLLPPFYLPPSDPTDSRTARFAGGMAADTAIVGVYDEATYVLLDTAAPNTTKLWRFVPSSQRYELLDTTAAQLGANISGIAVDTTQHHIYLTDSRNRRVVRLYWRGALDDSFAISPSYLHRPAGLAVSEPRQLLLVAVNGGQCGGGGVLAVNTSSGEALWFCCLWRLWDPTRWPISLALSEQATALYMADNTGRVFEIDRIVRPWIVAVHLITPAARDIRSMSVGADGTLYAIDTYSRRLIILSPLTRGLEIVDQCDSPLPRAPAASGSGATVAVVAAFACAAALAALAAGGYVRWQKRRHASSWWLRQAGERLINGSELQEEGSIDECELRLSRDQQTERSSSLFDSIAPVARVAKEEAGELVDVSTSKRYDYYVARYEVVAAVSDMRDKGLSIRRAARSTSQPLPVNIAHSTAHSFEQFSHTSPDTPSASSASSASSTPSSSIASVAHPTSSSDPSEYHTPNELLTPTCASTTASNASLALQSPPRIARLQSAWRAPIAPTFIDSVSDLTILGEGSSGVVYRAMHNGVACVVKLPKAAALSGSTWREWQCHMTLPSHANLVRFLGALAMSSTTYLVLGLVRQGNLHTLLRSAAGSIYTRPYAVMRCLRDMSAALRHVHAAGIVHRDVSCRNILVDSDGCMVLADLGLATLLAHNAHDELEHERQQQQRMAVPVRWTSPEALAGDSLSSISDVWALGVAAWEMTAGGALPYGERQRGTMACIWPIIAGQMTLRVDDAWGSVGASGSDSVVHCMAEQRLAERVRRLVQLCLTHDSQQRPDSERLAAETERQWQAWRAEESTATEQLDKEWAAWHGEVQLRLGAPSSPHQ